MTYAIKSAGYARNAGKRWRGADVKTLKALAREGAPLRLISLKLGRPDGAVRAKAQALGLDVSAGAPVIAPPPARTLSRHRPDLDQPKRKTRQLDLFGNA